MIAQAAVWLYGCALAEVRDSLQPEAHLITQCARTMPPRDNGKMLVLRWPSLRRPLDVLFLVACILLTADVLVPEIWGHGKTKDYPLWYWAGQQILHGGDLYPQGPSEGFAFLYPPLSAILLAIPSTFGKIPLYLGLCLLNAAAWWMTAQLSNAMTGSGTTPSPWLEALPGIVTIPFVFDMFDLGQPNLVLLAMMLFGFWCLWQGRGWLSGSMFALAAAIKAFPVALLPYLLWRRPLDERDKHGRFPWAFCWFRGPGSQSRAFHRNCFLNCTPWVPPGMGRNRTSGAMGFRASGDTPKTGSRG